MARVPLTAAVCEEEESIATSRLLLGFLKRGSVTGVAASTRKGQ
jgi:hypothetical protein